jgi:hypothetical protein
MDAEIDGFGKPFDVGCSVGALMFDDAYPACVFNSHRASPLRFIGYNRINIDRDL